VLSEDSDTFRERFTHKLMGSDAEYYDHLRLGESDGQPTQTTTDLILREVHPAGGTLAQRRWLDVGSGSGYLLKVVQSYGAEAIGVEPGGWGQIAARDKGVHVVQGFLDETTLPGKFDFVSATDVLEHQPDPAELLRLIRHYLQPSGLAFITVPFAESFHGTVLKWRWPMVEPPTHSHFFSRASFGSFLVRCGLKLEGMYQYNVTYPPLIGRLKVARQLVDFVLSTTLGGDQALFIARPTS
jgi:SAM-dependent methyltransferase